MTLLINKSENIKIVVIAKRHEENLNNCFYSVTQLFYNNFFFYFFLLIIHHRIENLKYYILTSLLKMIIIRRKTKNDKRHCHHFLFLQKKNMIENIKIKYLNYKQYFLSHINKKYFFWKKFNFDRKKCMLIISLFIEFFDPNI